MPGSKYGEIFTLSYYFSGSAWPQSVLTVTGQNCLEFKWNIFEAFTWFDMLYLISCGIPLLTLIPLLIEIFGDGYLSNYIFFTSEKSDENRLKFFNDRLALIADFDEFKTIVEQFDEEGVKFMFKAARMQNNFLAYKDIIAYNKVKKCFLRFL